MRITSAMLELHNAASRIAKSFNIPDDIGGQPAGTLLGRITYVPAMSHTQREKLTDVFIQQALTTGGDDLDVTVNFKSLLFASESIDWTRLTGQPCFHMERDGMFCGRLASQHDAAKGHSFVSLHQLLQSVQT